MNEVFFAALILFLVYVSQCFGSAPPFAVLFLLNDRLKGRLLRRAWETAPGGRRIFLLNPFLPHVGAVFADQIPFIVRCDAAGEPASIEALPSASGTLREMSFTVSHEIQAGSKIVCVDDEEFISLSSESAALSTAQFLNELQSTPNRKRAAALHNYFRQRFSLRALDERLDQYAKSSVWLQSVCFSLFFFVLLLAPVALFRLGVSRTWFALLLCLVLSCGSIVWLFVAAHRRIYPQKARWPLQQMTTLAFSPFAAIRANDLLVAELVAGFHPVAVARRLLRDGEFRSFAARELRTAKFLHHDEFLLRFLNDFLSQNGIHPDSLFASPLREGSSQSYCPVCLTQYTVPEGNCKDCRDTPLVHF